MKTQTPSVETPIDKDSLKEFLITIEAQLHFISNALKINAEYLAGDFLTPDKLFKVRPRTQGGDVNEHPRLDEMLLDCAETVNAIIKNLS